MATSCATLHVRCPNLELLGRTVALHIDDPALIARSENGWSTVVLGRGVLDRADALRVLAQAVAEASGESTFGCALHDSDDLRLVLGRPGDAPVEVQAGRAWVPDPSALADLTSGLALLSPHQSDAGTEEGRLVEMLTGPSGNAEDRIGAVEAWLGVDADPTGHTVDTLHDAIAEGDAHPAEVREVEPRTAGEADAALFRAIERGSHGAVAEALRDGADPNARSGKHRPLERALRANHSPQVYLLLEAGAKPETADLTDALDRSDTKLLTTMLASGYDLDAADPRSGATVLFWATHLERIPCMRVILEAGADVNRRMDLWKGLGGRRGVTALWGADTGLSAMATLLLAGADPDAADSHGVTLLMLAALTRFGGAQCVAFARQLLDAGADLQARTHDGKTALDLLGEQIDVYGLAQARDWPRCRTAAEALEASLGLGSAQANATLKDLRDAAPRAVGQALHALSEIQKWLSGRV